MGYFCAVPACLRVGDARYGPTHRQKGAVRRGISAKPSTKRIARILRLVTALNIPVTPFCKVQPLCNRMDWMSNEGQQVNCT